MFSRTPMIAMNFRKKLICFWQQEEKGEERRLQQATLGVLHRPGPVRWCHSVMCMQSGLSLMSQAETHNLGLCYRPGPVHWRHSVMPMQSGLPLMSQAETYTHTHNRLRRALIFMRQHKTCAHFWVMHFFNATKGQLNDATWIVYRSC